MLGRNLAVAGRADKPGNLKDKQFLEKKTMEVRGLLHVYSNVQINDEEYSNTWCTNLVNVLNANFDLKLAFGGNAVHLGSQH